MRKISIASAVIALMMLVSCGGGNVDKATKADDTAKSSDTIKETEVIESVSEKEENDVIDFATIDVKEFLLVKIGEEPLTYAEGGDAYASSKPSVATVDSEGVIVPVSPGVTLIGVARGDQTEAIAVCVFSEDERVDRTAGDSTSVFEVGETFMHVSPVGGAQYSSTNGDVVDVSEAPLLSFNEVGYACVTCENVSRPFFYNFVVYDRIVEE